MTDDRNRLEEIEMRHAEPLTFAVKHDDKTAAAIGQLLMDREWLILSVQQLIAEVERLRNAMPFSQYKQPNPFGRTNNPEGCAHHWEQQWKREYEYCPWCASLRPKEAKHVQEPEPQAERTTESDD